MNIDIHIGLYRNLNPKADIGQQKKSNPLFKLKRNEKNEKKIPLPIGPCAWK